MWIHKCVFGDINARISEIRDAGALMQNDESISEGCVWRGWTHTGCMKRRTSLKGRTWTRMQMKCTTMYTVRLAHACFIDPARSLFTPPFFCHPSFSSLYLLKAYLHVLFSPFNLPPTFFLSSLLSVCPSTFFVLWPVGAEQHVTLLISLSFFL